MKTMKKLVSVILMLTLVLSLSVSAFAAGITIEQKNDSHVYNAYQIFTGNISDGKLVEVKWGTGINPDTLLGLVNAGREDDDKLADTDALLNYVLNDLNDGNAKAWAALFDQAKGTPISVPYDEDAEQYSVSGLATGYYMVQDEAESVDKGEGYTSYILQVLGEESMKPKSGTTSSEKSVLEQNDSVNKPGEGTYGDNATYDAGDVVTFKLTVTLPENYDSFVKYYLDLRDKMTDGLTFNNDLKVTYNGIDITEAFKPVDGTSYTFERAAANLKEVIPQLAKNGDEFIYTIEITYTATLTEDANSETLEKNTFDTKFSNDPNWDGNGEPPTGTTPEDVVTVVSFDVVVDKTDEDGKALEGAGFTLEKKVVAEDGTISWVKIGEEVSAKADGSDRATLSFEGLDEGDYRLTETTVPAGYNKAADIEFTVSKKVTKVDGADDVIEAVVTVTSENGEMSVSGRDITTTIKNQSGATLPETGGIGTTIFYVIGGLLVAGAVILLVTKKRMGQE